MTLWLGTQAVGAVFEDANRFYEQGNYAEAIPLYRNLLKSGHNSPGVHFNLGNAYFKNGELGRAIYHYRRARQIAPRDPDIKANLRFARARVSGSISVQPSPADRFLRYFTLNEFATAAALFFWLWMGLSCWVRWRPSSRPALRIYIGYAAVLFIAAALVLVAAWRQARREVAVVAGRQAVVRLGPLAESQQAFSATDGTELRVLARRDNWLQVADRSGRAGWVNAGEVLLFSGLAKPSRGPA